MQSEGERSREERNGMDLQDIEVTDLLTAFSVLLSRPTTTFSACPCPWPCPCPSTTMSQLQIDPVLTDHDSDYEYEYHPSETEHFYLNLDLTSQHGPIRPPRRRNAPPPISSPGPESLTPPVVHPSIDEEESAIESTETDSVNLERVQLLGLHTPNPIVSYQNQIFSCNWADQVGTELFFASPDVEPEPSSEIPTLRRGQDFDLIAANSVKLLGRKADLISSAGLAPIQERLQPTTELDPATTNIPRRPGPQANQSRFLERLMSVKQAKGETDPVRTVYSTKKEQNLSDRLGGWARTDEQLMDIQRLNDAALQGDIDAIVTLENLWARVANSGSSDEP